MNSASFHASLFWKTLYELQRKNDIADRGDKSLNRIYPGQRSTEVMDLLIQINPKSRGFSLENELLLISPDSSVP